MNRPGIRTSEFWVTIVAMIIAALNEVFGLGLSGEEFAVIFGPAAAYIVSRGLAKIRTPGDAPAPGAPPSHGVHPSHGAAP